MRFKYQLALGALPIGLMLSSFLLLFLMAGWMAAALGIPPNFSVKDHPNGLLWLATFLCVFVVGVVGGYLLGWVLNAAIARYLLGWPASRVRAVFLNSEVPDHWLTRGTAATVGLDASRVLLGKWEGHRKGGVLRFVVVRGVITWGTPMFLGMYLVPTWMRDGVFTLSAAFGQVVLWLCAGCVFGLTAWYLSEFTYKRLKAKNER